MSLGVDTTALGLSFLINLIFRRIHELEGLHEDTFPDRGQTIQTAVILYVCVCVCGTSPWKGLICSWLGHAYVPVIFAQVCVCRLLAISQLCGSIHKGYVTLRV